eukprot:g69008.t1
MDLRFLSVHVNVLQSLNTSMTTTASVEILVVDDNPIQVKLIVKRLEQLQKQHPQAYSLNIEKEFDGQAVVTLVQARIASQQSCPDLILMDNEMPFMSGLEARLHLIEMNCPSHVVILSATPYMGGRSLKGAVCTTQTRQIKPGEAGAKPVSWRVIYRPGPAGRTTLPSGVQPVKAELKLQDPASNETVEQVTVLTDKAISFPLVEEEDRTAMVLPDKSASEESLLDKKDKDVLTPRTPARRRSLQLELRSLTTWELFPATDLDLVQQMLQREKSLERSSIPSAGGIGLASQVLLCMLLLAALFLVPLVYKNVFA